MASIAKKLMFWKKSSKKDAKSNTAASPTATQKKESSTPTKTTEKMANTDIPKTMEAVVVEGDKAVVKSDVPVPELEDGFVLIKVVAVAGNPTDWKHIAYKIAPEGAIVGCDAVGTIVKIGSNVDTNKFKIGEYAYGLVHGCSVAHPENGAFAQYAALDTKIAYSTPGLTIANKDIPEGKVENVESAASFPVSLTTAGVILHHNFDMKLEWNPSQPQNESPLLIWGGATAVGQPLIQLAKQMNCFSKIIVVASKKHESQLKTYGADEVFDYHDEDVIEQIRSKYDNIRYLVDAVSNPQTINQLYKCASHTEEATVLQLVTLSIKDIEESARRDNVKVSGTLLYQATGKAVPFGSMTLPADPVYRKHAVDFVEFITPKINNGDIHHIPIKVFKNGLQDIPGILTDIQEGKNSGQKYVAVLN